MFKQLLIKFLREKNKIIKEFTDIYYIYEEDILEISEEWSETACEYFLENMNSSSDSGCCPWCLLQYILICNHGKYDCNICGYGNRHGNCLDDCESLYNKIIKDNRRIVNIPGIRNLINKTLKDVRCFKGE